MNDDAEAGTAPTGEVPSAARRGPISHAIFRVARAHKMVAGHLLREVGLHPSQELVMMELWEHGALRQGDLARRVGSDAATMTRSVKRLEQAGFVRRIPSSTDKRSVIVEPTPASIALRRQVEAIWAELERTAAGDFTPAEREQALISLNRLEEALSRHAATSAEPECSDSL
ncbi:MarR family winged helix-turn-helix transcriptional regulator [Streptomyces sp. NPDC102415]|uniref:MarR family winged helix-turn-helix transcriptional regulator n=1 Tax=Streptomyces sp. NPDC102415 TaxID=3366173 RepID=UPI003826123C